jgi:hypothetical protein
MKNKFSKFLLFCFFATILNSCSSNIESKADKSPSWYIKPKQNNYENLYGVAEGLSLEESTKSALADCASRMIVSISSESTLIRNEDNNSSNEEMRQRVKQSIEKISFTNFKISKSEKIDNKFYIEVEIPRNQFINEQKERIAFVEKKITDLDKNSIGKNPIQRRTSLIKINDLSKELELKAMIIRGAGEMIDLKSKLDLIAKFQNELEKSSNDIEFFIDPSSPKEIAQLVRTALNKDKLKIITKIDNKNSNLVIIKIENSLKTQFIYESYITKNKIEFENLSEGKILASNSVEVTGNSSINEKESISASIKELEERISKDGILKILGILN